ncbi:MAG: hypothetical protein NZ954_02455 [Thermofilaceae archaeon]|nr:hypothetical protein [Thermofilaceae archaeon]MCX8181245.1 hypothetical protein [Thermofilaceae archaeon]MDW8003536.1 hypothetical protein [Thermofilaceae archaeon]
MVSTAIYLATFLFLASALTAAVAVELLNIFQALSLLSLTATSLLAVHKLAAKEPVDVFWSLVVLTVTLVATVGSFNLLPNPYLAVSLLLAGFGASALVSYAIGRHKG